MAFRPAPDAIMVLLAQHRVLRRVPEAELRKLVHTASVIVQLEGERIFGQGQPSDSVLAVVEGIVKLSSSTAAGREVVLEWAGPGTVFGEIGVMNEWPRSSDAWAQSRARLLSIEGAQFRRVLSAAPEALMEMIRVISERLRGATEQMTDGVDLPAPARLAKALLHLAGMHSHETPAGLRIDINLSQRELGGRTGLTRESVNKHLSGWRDRGMVQLGDGRITLTDIEALTAIASGG